MMHRVPARGTGRTFASITLALLIAGGGCADELAVGPGAPAELSEGYTRITGVNAAIPALRTMRDALPARTIELDPDRSAEPDVEALSGRVAANDGRVLIGIKPVGAERSRTTGVVPALSRPQMEAALAQLRAIGVDVTHSYRNFTFIGARVMPNQVESILALPFVDYVEASEPMQPLSMVQRTPPPAPGPVQDTSWGVFKIRAHEVWAGTYGPPSRGQYSNVTIIDSGLDSLHRWSPAGDGPDAIYVDCLYVTGVASSCYDQISDPDYRGHGALMAGIIAGTDNSVGQIGIANAPNLLASVNVCGTNPSCWLPDVSIALDWAIDETVAGLRPRHIVSISIGHCTGGAAISSAVTAAWNAGILLIAAAGNTTDVGSGCSPTTLRFPASYSPVIAVGGTLENDHFATPGASASCNAVGQTGGSVSNAGIDLVAPFSATSMWANGQYSFQCGTSISTPVVSGVAALLWTRNPSWTNAQIRNRLESTAQSVGSAAHFGHGRVDPLNALYNYTILSANISGPQMVVEAGSTVWNSYVTGGPSSYSYAWGYSTTQGGPFTSIGTSSSVSLNIDPSTPYEFWLQLLVTSGPEVSSDEIRVVNETGNPCAPYVCARAPGGGP